MDYAALAQQIKAWGRELGFQQVGICDIDLHDHEAPLQAWLDAGYHGEMAWMARHGMMRARPAELLPGTIRVISVRMDYLPPNAQFASNLNTPTHGYVSRYALGRDYHKLVRKQLTLLAQKIEHEVGKLGYRPFVDSAPILERPLAQKAGLGWTGKHSLIINPNAGSWFFLGELLVDIPLPVDTAAINQCGKCVACQTACPTQAIVADGIVDARRCISYLTIEFDGVIPEKFRRAIGNRIYGCDDCQLVCPWNRHTPLTEEVDFHRRHSFDNPNLCDYFSWSEAQFLKQMEGSPIRRIGHWQWLRNIAIALGNAPYSPSIVTALTARLGEHNVLDEHIHWALAEQQQKATQALPFQATSQQMRLIRIVEKGLPRDA
ncbi:tRNA epoxyqueuosine(34) reductase QueG [Vibrio sp. SM6]|uniref:Epoxyqueuosine reductase n=1 Tax=Vibrio agarilyticus TaxID=2726741 RepID=A0A7X8TTM9_9VIBR|nr:tRNA epoxyqueuosine(34) reductase QueG [Vibrio agarilyticus]NLS14690.1 tRNA epoxyqueuosine(34) reductase QueG [Vibrio agarilyticus]